ncbi:MAG TPA: HEAT repeat domain-containing protein, partial [Pyrinomonadaceae bacterium]|nr:HEAT repeat domain-containing protein [Pyrinomonadaceae bacterium]
ESDECISAGGESLDSDSPETVDSELPTECATAENPESAVDLVSFEEAVPETRSDVALVNSLPERLSSDNQNERNQVIQELDRLKDNVAFPLLTSLFDDNSEKVRNAAARTLYDLSTERADSFARALREASPERRGRIVEAIEACGLVAESIESLAGESREKTHEAFSMLYLMAKSGEVKFLFQTIEKHPNIQVRLSVIKLLTFTKRPDIIPALRSLAVRGALPIEVRSALMKAIYEMSSGTRERSLSAA